MWPKRQPPRSQVTREELENYLVSNPYTPVFVVSKEDIIKGSVMFDESDFIGNNYLKLDEEGWPTKIVIPTEKYETLLSHISENHLLYTVHGMKLTLDKLDNLSK